MKNIREKICYYKKGPGYIFDRVFGQGGPGNLKLFVKDTFIPNLKIESFFVWTQESAARHQIGDIFLEESNKFQA